MLDLMKHEGLKPSQLAEQLEINPAEPRYIKVVWGKGYKMEVNPI